MLTTSLEDRASIVSQRLNTYNGALTEVRTRIAGLQARVDAIDSLRKGVDTAKDPDWADVLTQSFTLGTGHHAQGAATSRRRPTARR